jgi:hypothetical protein
MQGTVSEIYRELLRQAGEEHYSSFEEVLFEVTDVLVIDLRPYLTTRVGPMGIYRGVMETGTGVRPRENPKGVYMRGRLFPVADFDYWHHWKEDHARSEIKLVKTPEEWLTGTATMTRTTMDPDGSREEEVTAFNPSGFPQLYQTEGSFSVSEGIGVAMAVEVIVRNYLSPNCKVKVKPVGDAVLYYDEAYAPEQLPTEDQTAGRTNAGFFELEKKLVSFVGTGMADIKITMNDSMLRLEKRLDYRIVAYYRDLFKKIDEQLDQSHGV